MKITRSIGWLLGASALLSLGCRASYGDGSGATEPIVVTGATFNSGDLPNDGGDPLPLTTSVSSSGFAGGADKTLSGRAGLHAYAVAVRMKDAGTGYYVVPVGLPDLVEPGLTWSLKFHFTREAPLGDQILQVAQTDVNGKFSTPSEVPFKVKSLVPEGKKVISLIWHNHADLDLQVQSPDGKITSSKHPNTSDVPKDHKIPPGGIEGSGTYNRDSNQHCVFDGLMEEDVVFAGDPEPGTYQVWVDLYDHCGEPATNFELSLHEDGVETFERVGQLLDINADNGTGAGLFMNEFNF